MKNKDVKFEEELIDFRRSQIWMNQVKGHKTQHIPAVQIAAAMVVVMLIIVAAHYLGWIEVAKTQGI